MSMQEYSKSKLTFLSVTDNFTMDFYTLDGAWKALQE